MKIKSIAAALLAASVIIGQTPLTNAAFSEEIKLNVVALDPVDYDETNQQFTMLDLREFANRDFTDDVAGDGTGGWSDQGDNDMRMFPYRGNVKFENIPFQLPVIRNLHPERPFGQADNLSILHQHPIRSV